MTMISQGAAASREAARHNDGTFGHQHRAEASGVSLAPRNAAQLERTLPELDLTDLQAEHNLAALTEAVQISSKFWASRYGTERRSNAYTVDDIAQETLMAIWKDHTAGKVPTSPRKYVVSVAANVSVRMTQDQKRFQAEDRRAMRELKTKLEAIQAAEGRHPTRAEHEAAKAQVLAEWHDPRHRPHEDFDRAPGMATSLDRPVGSDPDGTTLGSMLQERTVNGRTIVPGSVLDQVSQDVESRGEKAQARRMRQFWNAVAEGAELAQTTGGSLDAARVARHQAAMLAHPGGVAQAIRDWQQGESNPGVQALIAPFGNLKMRQEQAVVDQMAALTRGMSGEQAQTLYSGVLASAGPEGLADEAEMTTERARILAGTDAATRRARKAMTEGRAA